MGKDSHNKRSWQNYRQPRVYRLVALEWYYIHPNVFLIVSTTQTLKLIQMDLETNRQ